MNFESNSYCPDALHRLLLYLTGTLPPREIAEMEAHISRCPSCRVECETLTHVVQLFVAPPSDIARPSPSVWDRLAQQIAKETGLPPLAAPGEKPIPEWTEVAPGISVNVLTEDLERDRVGMLVRLTPGTDYPPHRHAGFEELYLLNGVLNVDQKMLYPGDFIRSAPHSMDRRVWSETGCTCLLITSTKDELLSE